jgi:type IV secretory pathway VirB10-like protein
MPDSTSRMRFYTASVQSFRQEGDWTLGRTRQALLGVGTESTFGSGQSNLVQPIEQSAQESTDRAGQHIVDKGLNIQPTITIRPGWPLRVIVSKDIVPRPYQGEGRLLCLS